MHVLVCPCNLHLHSGERLVADMYSCICSLKEQNKTKRSKDADAIWCITFNFVDLRHKHVFASCGGRRVHCCMLIGCTLLNTVLIGTTGCVLKGTVYECKPGGTIEALQAYYDPNVSLHCSSQVGQVKSICLHIFFLSTSIVYTARRGVLCVQMEHQQHHWSSSSSLGRSNWRNQGSGLSLEKGRMGEPPTPCPPTPLPIPPALTDIAVMCCLPLCTWFMMLRLSPRHACNAAQDTKVLSGACRLACIVLPLCRVLIPAVLQEVGQLTHTAWPHLHSEHFSMLKSVQPHGSCLTVGLGAADSSRSWRRSE